MISNTQSVTLKAPRHRVFAYLTNPFNLKKWAINFVQDVVQRNGSVIAITPIGALTTQILANEQWGTVDIKMDEMIFPGRLTPNGEGCNYSFTMYRSVEMSDEQWQNGIRGLKEELSILKKLIENEYRNGS